MRTLVILFFLAVHLSGLAASREAQWKKVDEAVQQGLPKTAIDLLDPIIKEALAEKAWAEAVKAQIRKIVLDGNIQGNKPEEKITRLETVLSTAPAPIRPLYETFLAHWYWHYYQNNNWRFRQRTQTAQPPGKDFTTWDLPRLFAEIDRHFNNALNAEKFLQTIPINEYNSLIVRGTVPDSYRPTLYDLLAHEALAFYQSGDGAFTRSEAPFELSAQDPIFDSVEKFLQWQPKTTETNSFTYKAIKLYQRLLTFHQKDRNQDAFIDLDLARLVLGKNHAVGDDLNSRFQNALKSFVERWGDHPVSALALYRWALLQQEEDNLVEARTLARRAVQNFPDSPGGRMAFNLIQQLEAKELSLFTERVWNAPWPKLQVQYRSLTNVHFRIVTYEWESFLSRRHNRPENLNDEERGELLRRTPVLSWSVAVPATTNLKTRVEEVPAPEKLKPGFYFIIASALPSFPATNNQVTFTDFWVSDLALVVRPRAGNLEGFVLSALSGEPIKGAQIDFWHLDPQGNRILNAPAVTDEMGLFTMLRKGREQGYLIRARHDGQQIAAPHDYSASRPQDPQPTTQTIFFTDRTLYRPGQTIQYKGICLSVDQNQDKYEAMARQVVTVVLRDPNGQEVETREHRANDFGSFAGSFTAPRDRLTGAMQIVVKSGPRGARQLRVEEYKRPKFEVSLDPPKTAPRLNDKVIVEGKAISYTGAAIDDAKVNYRVVREVRWPVWWHYYYRSSPRQGASQEIVHGTTRVNTDGTIKIEFVAKPDLSISETNEPVFTFSVFVDVIDSSGETRSAQQQVRAGYTALQVNLSANEWLTDDKPVELRVLTQTLDGIGQQAEGAVKIYRMTPPAQVERTHFQNYSTEPTGERRDLSNPIHWPLGDLVSEKGFTTDKEGKLQMTFNLQEGAYRVVAESEDRFGKKVKMPLQLLVVNPAAKKLGIKIPYLVTAPDWSLGPGEEFMALWGTGYERGRAFIEIEHRHKILKRFWTPANETQHAIRQAISENMRGGFTLHVTQIRENRAYLQTRRIDVPWTNKDLQVKWEHFRSKLFPAEKETWTAIISGTNAEKAVAEMVATLYDASLDAFAPHHWQSGFGFFRQDYTSGHPDFANLLKPFQWLQGQWDYPSRSVDFRYRHLPSELTQNSFGYEFESGMDNRWYYAERLSASGGRGNIQTRMRGEGRAERLSVLNATPMVSMDAAAPAEMAMQAKASMANETPAPPPGSPVDLKQVTARKNLNETAFFFPQLISESNGLVRLEFTMPEALTRWRFMGFAHDAQCRSGFLEDTLVTAKDLMVQPNPPRFLREGDILEFTVKVSNQSETNQQGKVQLAFRDARLDASVDRELGNTKNEFAFAIPAKASKSFSWKIKVPDSMGFLTYKALAASQNIADGEEGFLPVLSRRIPVTESLAIPIRGPGTKKVEFKKLLASGKSDSLIHQGVTVQMVSNPSWYAVLALPYLMEFPHECSEQIFNRLYANSLARHIALSDPKIARVFEQWKNTPALDSPLEKNEQLKSVLLLETPWVRQAKAESQARRDVAILFDRNRLDYETKANLRKLEEMQLSDGLWPWFPGGRGNDYITLYITGGFARLRHLGVDINLQAALKSLNRLDAWIDEQYREILKHSNKEANHLTPTIALYLYTRSFFLKDRPVTNGKEAVDYFLGQSRKYWLQLANRQSQAHLALGLKRFGDATTPIAILKSIKERSVSDPELGMFWRETELSWWWYRAPIETQAMMVEAFSEVTGDLDAVEDCKVWLIKQKQTQDWKTTKATADAVYALLLRGKNALASDKLLEVTVGGRTLQPEQVEAGTGFYEKRFTGTDVKPKLGEITVRKVDEGVAWGSIHWQYLEDVAKITPHEGTPLKLKKTVYRKAASIRGPVLEPVKGPLAVGDELVVRIELRTDRDMEYLHLKDQRGSGLEPLNVLSGYRYQDGLAYYESTKDTASHFFIDYLPKGVYVFEYSTRVVHRGDYQTGIAQIQSMYAPEFNSHSESFLLTAR